MIYQSHLLPVGEIRNNFGEFTPRSISLGSSTEKSTRCKSMSIEGMGQEEWQTQVWDVEGSGPHCGLGPSQGLMAHCPAATASLQRVVAAEPGLQAAKLLPPTPQLLCLPCMVLGCSPQPGPSQQPDVLFCPPERVTCMENVAMQHCDSA